MKAFTSGYLHLAFRVSLFLRAVSKCFLNSSRLGAAVLAFAESGE